MTDDLVTWLRVQLDEDEQVATEAEGASWSWSHGQGEMCNDAECPFGQLVAETKPYPTVLMNVHGYDIRDGWQGAAHIALHDPARVLAEVAAKRRHIERYEEVDALLGGDCPNGVIRNELLSVRRAYRLCIADDALPYAGRPGYRNEWRPVVTST